LAWAESVTSGALEARASFRFELALPPDGLPNFTSRHGRLYWRLDVKSDERGRDSHELRRIDVDLCPVRCSARRGG